MVDPVLYLTPLRQHFMYNVLVAISVTLLIVTDKLS